MSCNFLNWIIAGCTLSKSVFCTPQDRSASLTPAGKMVRLVGIPQLLGNASLVKFQLTCMVNERQFCGNLGTNELFMCHGTEGVRCCCTETPILVAPFFFAHFRINMTVCTCQTVRFAFRCRKIYPRMQKSPSLWKFATKLRNRRGTRL